jgi:hypothetical protein
MNDAMKAIEGDLRSSAITSAPSVRALTWPFLSQPETSPTAALAEKIGESLNLTEITFLCHSCQHEWPANTH